MLEKTPNIFGDQESDWRNKGNGFDGFTFGRSVRSVHNLWVVVYSAKRHGSTPPAPDRSQTFYLLFAKSVFRNENFRDRNPKCLRPASDAVLPLGLGRSVGRSACWPQTSSNTECPFILASFDPSPSVTCTQYARTSWEGIVCSFKYNVFTHTLSFFFSLSLIFSLFLSFLSLSLCVYKTWKSF